MGKKNTAKLVAAASIVGSAALLPAALSAQLDAQSSPVPRYHLVQVSVDGQTVAPAEFKAKTEAIRSCGDAASLAKTMNADVTRNRFVRATVLPEQLRETLETLPIGHATPVFSNDGNTLRVLVVCNPA